VRASGDGALGPVAAPDLPVTFVAYLYETDALYDVSPVAVALAFLYGGVLGTVAAQISRRSSC